MILGPESTGKSTLCAQLADYFDTRWVKEYAREYLLTHGTAYAFDDLLEIARGQARLEDEVVASLQNLQINNGKKMDTIPQGVENPYELVFIDTNMYVIKVWSEFVFGKCHQWILDEIVERKYDLYLLCDIDLPWVKDELREYPDPSVREKLYLHYKDIMVNQVVPWVNITGQYEERLKVAIKAINQLTN